jgi:outer membrane protein OmpA-like peptidoglycan-associated protein
LSSHTDSRASDAHNQDLSQRRAESAVKYLIQSGINAGRITAKGYGETRLLIPDAKDEEEHQKNRRTEIKILEI